MLIMFTLTLTQRLVFGRRRRRTDGDGGRPTSSLVQPSAAPCRSRRRRSRTRHRPVARSTARRHPRPHRLRADAHDRRLHAAGRDRAPLLRAVPLDGLDVAEDAARDRLLQPAAQAPDARTPTGRPYDDFHFARYAANSVGLAATVTVLNVFLCSLGGYAFARLRFPGREVLFFSCWSP